MSKLPITLPVARHWRDIPQEVKPRALSREGRRRAAVRGLRLTGLVVGIGIAAAAAWQVTLALENGGPNRPASAGERIAGHVRALSDGVLNHDDAWLRKTLALPADATLNGIDLDLLRRRILASGQVQAADIRRDFPSTLIVDMQERTPVARVCVQQGDGPRETLLVARDGTVYAGRDYDPQLLATLPWLAGVTPHAGGLGPIAGMDAVGDLLATAKLNAPGRYADWRVVSLARLASDGLIDVTTRGGQTLVFGAQNGDFIQQIARLDYVLDIAAQHNPPIALGRIDLSLGSQVPVSLVAPADGATSAAPPPGAPAAPSLAAATAPAYRFHVQLP